MNTCDRVVSTGLPTPAHSTNGVKDTLSKAEDMSLKANAKAMTLKPRPRTWHIMPNPSKVVFRSHCKQSVESSIESYLVVTRCLKYAYCTWATSSERAPCLPNMHDVHVISFHMTEMHLRGADTTGTQNISETEASVSSQPLAMD